MRTLKFADAEVMQVAIRQEIDRSEESRYDYRLHGVLLVASGRSCTAVSQVFGEDATTAQRWVRRFEHRGFAGLHDGVSLAVRQCQRIFNQMGFRLRKPRSQAAQADLLALRRVTTLRRLAKRTDNERWSVGKCHFQQHRTRTRIWVPREIKDPVLIHAPPRRLVACFGAVCLQTGKFVRSICPQFHALTFEAFLKTWLRYRSRGTRMAVVLDHARYTMPPCWRRCGARTDES
jgi:transposase